MGFLHVVTLMTIYNRHLNNNYIHAVTVVNNPLWYTVS